MEFRGMTSIQDLLAKHRIPGTKDAEIRRVCADTASLLLKSKLSPSLFTYNAGELSTKLSPILKTELLMRQPEYAQLLSAQGVKLIAIR